MAEKIFVGWGRLDDGDMSLGFRTSLELQSMLVRSDPRFSTAKYVGKYGGVDMRLGAKPNWDEVEQFIIASYRVIAPKKLVRELDAKPGGVTPARAPKAPNNKPTARSMPAARKPAARTKRTSR